MKLLRSAFLAILYTNVVAAQNTSLDWAIATNSETGPMIGRSITTDSDGSVIVVGEFSGTADFDPGPDSTMLTSEWLTSIFIQKLDDSGNLIWAGSFGGGYGSVAAVAVDGTDNIYLTGHFQVTGDFDPGIDTFNLISMGGNELFVLKLDANGDFIWAKSFGGEESEQPSSMDIDSSGNVYITGWFDGTVDFDPGVGVSTHICNGWTDVFVLKLDTDGEFVWATSMGGIGEDNGVDLDVGPAGNVHLTGHFVQTVDFDPGSGTYDLTAANSGSPILYPDMFIQTLDPEGGLLWVKRIGANGPDKGKEITTDYEGNIYLAGQISDTLDFDPGPDSLILIPTEDRSHFIQKLDAEGNHQWAKMDNIATDMATDSSGDLFLTGTFQDTEDIDPGMDTLNMTASGYIDGFIKKLSPSGDLQWAVHLEGFHQFYPSSIHSGTQGGVVATGGFMGMVDLDPGPDSLFFSAMPGGVFTLKLNQENSVSVEENERVHDLTLFPNPTSGRITIDLGAVIEPTVRVFSVQGELVQESVLVKAERLDLTIDGPSGIYIVEIQSGGFVKKEFRVIKH